MTSLTLAPNDLSNLYIPGSQLETPDIKDYLAMMLAKYDEGDEQCLFLPSLIGMSECFQCSAVEVHHALSELKLRGCDIFMMGFESPITLWYPDRLGRAQVS